jgi:hypothetical protein
MIWRKFALYPFTDSDMVLRSYTCLLQHYPKAVTGHP